MKLKVFLARRSTIIQRSNIVLYVPTSGEMQRKRYRSGGPYRETENRHRQARWLLR